MLGCIASMTTKESHRGAKAVWLHMTTFTRSNHVKTNKAKLREEAAVALRRFYDAAAKHRPDEDALPQGLYDAEETSSDAKLLLRWGFRLLDPARSRGKFWRVRREMEENRILPKRDVE